MRLHDTLFDVITLCFQMCFSCRNT